jgi:phosphoribosylformylglycinamidine cyclo-ligase
MAHITGGGITDNLPRILPEGVHAEIDRASWKVPLIFAWLQQTGNVPREDMFRAFNMGVGLIVACAEADADPVIDALRAAGEPDVFRVGVIRAGGEGVRYVG